MPELTFTQKMEARDAVGVKLQVKLNEMYNELGAESDHIPIQSLRHLKESIIMIADSRFAFLPQYVDFFKDYVLIMVKDRVTTKLGICAEPRDIVIAKVEKSILNQKETWAIFSMRTFSLVSIADTPFHIL